MWGVGSGGVETCGWMFRGEVELGKRLTGHVRVAAPPRWCSLFSNIVKDKLWVISRVRILAVAPCTAHMRN
ncbi:hypothetical protein K440DRAFT_373129 [Wilcoxina mikolae CBS 423.85]|nr:hypothetical protein K440DRAFT_373129 [Wilcoxina mikolae CBS 423.85]